MCTRICCAGPRKPSFSISTEKCCLTLSSYMEPKGWLSLGTCNGALSASCMHPPFAPALRRLPFFWSSQPATSAGLLRLPVSLCPAIFSVIHFTRPSHRCPASPRRRPPAGPSVGHAAGLARRLSPSVISAGPPVLGLRPSEPPPGPLESGARRGREVLVAVSPSRIPSLSSSKSRNKSWGLRSCVTMGNPYATAWPRWSAMRRTTYEGHRAGTANMRRRVHGFFF